MHGGLRSIIATRTHIRIRHMAMIPLLVAGMEPELNRFGGHVANKLEKNFNKQLSIQKIKIIKFNGKA